MLCVTGAEKSWEALGARLARVASQAGGASLLQEVRLDALDRPGEGLEEGLAPWRDRLVVCCRPPRQGGAFAGSEEERLALLARAAASGVAYLDLEEELPDAALSRLRSLGARQLVLSHHDFDGLSPELLGRLERMASRPVDLVKLAARVDDAAELTALLELGQRLGRPAIVIGMGLAGLLSRARYPAFGSPWTYVAATAELATAPGQLSLAAALELGLPEGARAPFVALLGGAQVAHSPGPVVYNRLFRRRGKAWSYLPVASAEAAKSLALLRRLGALGASVTMPHKAAVLDGALLDERARELGAANTLRFDGSETRATNTDVEGVAVPLGRALRGAALGERPGCVALVQGAGGAARAAALACRELGLEVVVSARSRDRAALAVALAGGRFVAWADRASLGAEVLVNATPLRDDGAWPAEAPLPRVVFDLAIGPGASPLVARSEREGARLLRPEEMWLHQGATQMSFITGEPVDAEELRSLLP